MNLVPLSCVKCGSPLNFEGSLICVCGSCNTPHALVDSQGLLSSVSFLPSVQRRDGKMETSLKLLLAERIREAGFVVREGNHFADWDALRIDKGRIYNRYLIGNDLSEPIVVARGYIERKEVTVTRFLRDSITTYEDVPHCEDILKVWIVPVEFDDGGKKILAGYRILIGVRLPKYEEEANDLSQKIREWFKVTPEVALLNG